MVHLQYDDRHSSSCGELIGTALLLLAYIPIHNQRPLSTKICRYTPRGNDTISQKEHPDPIPPLAILLHHLVLIRYPVLVPPINRSRIMHPKDVNVFYLKPSALELGYDPSERARSIGTWEYIFIHEKAPDEVLVLPGRADSSDLENEDPVVGKEVINLAKERTISADANMLAQIRQYHAMIFESLD
jgi:hypothetical protein